VTIPARKLARMILPVTILVTVAVRMILPVTVPAMTVVTIPEDRADTGISG